MTDVAASDFRHPRRYVRLDTILRLRWLAVLGQLAAIFIVVQGLEFDVPVIPCVTIVGLSALLNLVLQIAFNPMQRLEPVYAAALLALNIVELAGAAVSDRRPAESVFVPVPRPGPDLGDRAADPADDRARRCSRSPAPRCWCSSICRCRGTATTRWCCRRSICSASGSRSCSRSASPASMRSRSTEEARKLSDALAATELVLTREQHLTQLDGLAAAAAHELGTPLSTIFLISRELEKTVDGQRPARRRPQDPARTGAALPRHPGQDHAAVRNRRAVRPHAAVDADRGNGGAASRFRRRDQGADRGRRHAASRSARRNPAILYGVGNILENAVDFARDDGGGERVVEHRDGRDRHFRRRAGHRARHPEADRRALSVTAAQRRMKPRASAARPRSRRVHRPHAAGAHRRQGLLHQPDLSRSRRRGSDRLAARPLRGRRNRCRTSGLDRSRHDAGRSTLGGLGSATLPRHMLYMMPEHPQPMGIPEP